MRIGDAHRAQLGVGTDGAVVVADVHADQVAPTTGVVTHVVKIRVPDVDAAFERARDFGAGVLEEPRPGSTASVHACCEDRRPSLGADADDA